MDHTFDALGLRNALLRVYDIHIAGIRTYEKAGFQRIDIYHDSEVMGGRRWDTRFIEALDDRLESPVLGRHPDTPR